MRKVKSLVATIVVALMSMPTLEVQVCKTPNETSPPIRSRLSLHCTD